VSLETQTDVYGDFEFEGLEKNETYRVRISLTGYEDQEIEFTTQKDVNLGEIMLAPK
jgi:hypothetical protein